MEHPTPLFTHLNRSVPCYAATIFSQNTIWHGTNPLVQALPLFIFQLTLVVFFTRFFLLIFKPFRQPRFVAEILSGILLGPSCFGRIRPFTNLFFPPLGFWVLDLMAHFSLIHYAFLVGLEMDLTNLSRTGTKALTVAISGTLIPLALGAAIYMPFRETSNNGSDVLFWAAALTVTGCSVLAQLLERLKILQTELGKTALSSALITELCSWILFAVALCSSIESTHWAILATSAFVLFAIFYIRPAIVWMIRRKPEGQGYSEYYITFFLVGVSLCGVMADGCGTHPIIGAFVFGLVIPNGVLEVKIIERLEEFVSGFLMPIFFVVCGLRFDIDGLANQRWAWALSVIPMACAAKVLSTIVVSFFRRVPVKEAISLGILMNTKSLLAVVILYIGLEQQALVLETYTIMVIAVLVMTIAVKPIMTMNKPERKYMPYKRRTIQKANPNEELRVLACVHGPRNVAGVLNLLEASHATRDSPISVFALHLVELIGHASAMLSVQNTRKSGSKNPTLEESQNDQIITAFEFYERKSEFVSVQTLLARSAYSTMDEDICNIADDKRVALIVLPFHKLQGLNGEMEDINPSIRDVNEGVLGNAPCSVAILIDRGLAESVQFTRRVVMLYFGGPDDREALIYAWRLSQHPDVRLSVVRFLPSKTGAATAAAESVEFKPHGAVALNIDGDRERDNDEEFINKFKIMSASEESISFSEMVLNDEEETVRAIKSMDQEYELYIVGKGRGVTSPLTAGLEDWCDCPELGPIGDALVTSEFSKAFSVLVVQQYNKAATLRGDEISSISSMNQREEFGWRSPSAEDDEFDAFSRDQKDIDDDY